MKNFMLIVASLLMPMYATTVFAQDTDPTHVYIDETKTWVFDDLAPINNGDNIFENETSEWEGLYFKLFSGHKFQGYSGNWSGTFSDRTEWKTSCRIRTQNIVDFLCDSHIARAWSNVTRYTDRCIALQTKVAGTLYVAFASVYEKAGQYMDLYNRQTLVDAKELAEKNVMQELKAHTDVIDEDGKGKMIGGVFYIVPEQQVWIYAIRFVADSNTAIDEVNTDTSGNGNYYNLIGQEIVKPAKGLYIKDGKKYIVR